MATHVYEIIPQQVRPRGAGPYAAHEQYAAHPLSSRCRWCVRNADTRWSSCIDRAPPDEKMSKRVLDKHYYYFLAEIIFGYLKTFTLAAARRCRVSSLGERNRRKYFRLSSSLSNTRLQP